MTQERRFVFLSTAALVAVATGWIWLLFAYADLMLGQR
jgi:hypothetical protein